MAHEPIYAHTFGMEIQLDILFRSSAIEIACYQPNGHSSITQLAGK